MVVVVGMGHGEVVAMSVWLNHFGETRMSSSKEEREERPYRVLMEVE